MDDGIGFKGANVIKFNEILAFARSVRRYLILHGDFNMDPAHLQEAAGLDELELDIIKPENAEFTCLQGSGTLSTFFVVSRPIAHRNLQRIVIGESKAG